MLGDNPILVISANVLALLFGASIVWLAHALGKEDNTRSKNFLLCLLGALIGWVIGILATPLNPNEKADFLTLGQAISAFVSGYLVSKLDRFFEKALFTENGIQTVAWQRMGLLAASLLLMMTVVFVNRSYIHRPAPQANAQSAASSVGTSNP
jgi:small basic protein